MMRISPGLFHFIAFSDNIHDPIFLSCHMDFFLAGKTDLILRGHCRRGMQEPSG